MKENRSLLDTDLLKETPAWVATAFGMFVCAVIAYYTGELVLVLLGQSAQVIFAPLHLATIVAYLVVVSAVGLLARRVFLVAALVGVLAGGFNAWAALHGAGPVLPWIRSIGVNLLWPIVNGFLFSRYLVYVRRARGH